MLETLYSQLKILCLYDVYICMCVYVGGFMCQHVCVEVREQLAAIDSAITSRLRELRLSGVHSKQARLSWKINIAILKRSLEMSDSGT